MKPFRIISLLLLFIIAFSVEAETPYRVISSSRLNVRKAPSVSGAVLGTLRSGENVDVIDINNGWAKVSYKGAVGYVNTKYIEAVQINAPAPSYIPAPTTSREPVDDYQESGFDDTCDVKREASDNLGLYEVKTPIAFGSKLSPKLNLYFTIEIGMGYSTFMLNKSYISGRMAYSVDIAAQLYCESKTLFLPTNWYSEFALGYDSKGSSKSKMEYLHAGIYPLGYRIPLRPISVVLKGGVVLGMPLNKISNTVNSRKSDFQCGAGVGIRVEWSQFAIGCNFEYDFTDVSSSSPKYNNLAVLGTISYKFARLGHK